MNYRSLAFIGAAAVAGMPPAGNTLLADLELALTFDNGGDRGDDISPQNHDMTTVDSPVVVTGKRTDGIEMDDASGGHFSLAAASASAKLRGVDGSQTGFTIAFWIYVPTGTTIGGYVFDNGAIQVFLGTNGSGDVIPYFQINATVGGFTALYPTTAVGVAFDTWGIIQCRCTYAHAGYSGNTVLESRVNNEAWEILDVSSNDVPTDGGTPKDVFVLAYNNTRSGAGPTIDELYVWGVPKSDADLNALLGPLYAPSF